MPKYAQSLCRGSSRRGIPRPEACLHLLCKKLQQNSAALPPVPSLPFFPSSLTVCGGFRGVSPAVLRRAVALQDTDWKELAPGCSWLHQGLCCRRCS